MFFQWLTVGFDVGIGLAGALHGGEEQEYHGGGFGPIPYYRGRLPGSVSRLQEQEGPAPFAGINLRFGARF